MYGSGWVALGLDIDIDLEINVTAVHALSRGPCCHAINLEFWCAIAHASSVSRHST